jgi:hypothetical protein
MSFSMIAGNVQAAGVVAITITPASVAAATTAEQTFACPGVRVGDYVDVTGVTQNGVGIGQARVTANNTVGIRFINTTAGALTPTAGAYTVLVVRTGSPALPSGFAP